MIHYISPHDTILDACHENINKLVLSNNQNISYKSLPYKTKYDINLDFYESVLKFCKTDDYCIVALKPIFNFSQDHDASFCNDEKLTNFNLCMSITHFSEKYRTYKFLESKNPALVSSSMIAGNWSFWNQYVPFYRYLWTKDYFQKRMFCEDMVLNLFLALNGNLNIKVF